MSGVRSPLTWIGGKTRLVGWILPHLTSHCEVYVEPFGGSAAVLLNRQPSKIEVYNDLDGELVTFMLCVKHHYEELYREIRAIPYSREIFLEDLRWLTEGCPGRLTDIQFAARWWYLNLLSFGAGMRSFGTAVSTSRVHQLLNRLPDLQGTQRRLMNVLIERDDFRAVIKRYDSPHTLYYCDPPYVGTRAMYPTVGEFTQDDHRDLACILNQIKGRAAVSYYPHPLIDELYSFKKWHRFTRSWTKSIAGTTGNQRNKRSKRPKSVEMLLLNYRPQSS